MFAREADKLSNNGNKPFLVSTRKKNTPVKYKKGKKFVAVARDICEWLPEPRTRELEVTLWLWAVSKD